MREREKSNMKRILFGLAKGADDEDSASVAWVSLKLNPQNNVFDQYQSIYLCNNESFSLDFLDLEIQLDGKSREWLVKAAQGDYHELAKLAAEEPRLTGLKCGLPWWGPFDQTCRYYTHDGT
ncbi:ankyrin repeat domain-containing protein SOWAHC-like isoform X4 [Vespula maculifrons]|uniref:Ankyrin repeat domain-containing protein SOWAHC-like isoform X4 n=1 Tax=Vespula maculifrons TaxID=7453 RepID=A0ABD2CWE4_VESMC